MAYIAEFGKKPYQQEQLELALRYGVNLPKPARLRLALPAFPIGSCDTVLFSPSGEYLLASTSNGCFLWEAASGTKLSRLKGPTNPLEFAFSADSSELLMRNEQSQFARFAIPSGELLARFTAKYPFRLNGTGCFGPAQKTVLQLAHEGMFLVLDADNGEVLHKYQLERTGYSGQVFYLPERGEVIVAQISVANSRNLSTPCALWRWQWPLEASVPERQSQTWIGLHAALLGGRLLLHHQPDCNRDEFAIDVIEIESMKVLRRIACGGGIHLGPTLSHDGQAWAASTESVIQVGIGESRFDLPIRNRQAQFHPTRDLVAVPGVAGFVVPRAQLPTLTPLLQKYHDELELTQRGYARMTTLPGKMMPPRIIVYARPDSFLIQAERFDGRHYLPLAMPKEIHASATPEELSARIEVALDQARSETEILEPATVNERRHFLGGVVTPPTHGWRSAVAVSFAVDAIDLWPLKPSGVHAFKHTWYPVAALPQNTRGSELWRAIARMMRHFKPRVSNA